MFGGSHIERFRGVIDDLLRLTDGWEPVTSKSPVLSSSISVASI